MIFNMIGKGGSGESLIISDTIDSNGGIIRTITGKVVKLQTKTITPTSSTQVVDPDDGYDGFSKITVEAGGGGITPTGNIDITRAGTTDVTNYATATVPSAEFLTGIDYEYYTENNIRKWHFRGKTELDTGEGDTEGWLAEGTYYGDYVVRNAVPSGTIVSPSTSSQTIGGTNYMMEGAVTVAAMPTMILPTSASSSATSGYTNKATISRSTSEQYINIPTGYNSAGGYYTISATPNGSVTTPSSISGTSATISTGTNTLTLTKTISVTPNVTTAGYISTGTAGNASVSLTASVTTKAAATITPSTSNQTIASGTYLTGTQTIAGDADLVASNIVSGVQIFGVTGNVVLQNYYTGSSAPSSSIGSNGDLYLQS